MSRPDVMAWFLKAENLSHAVSGKCECGRMVREMLTLKMEGGDHEPKNMGDL